MIVLPLNLFTLRALMIESCSDKVARRGMILVWHATVWMLWSIRNGKKTIIIGRACWKKWLIGLKRYLGGDSLVEWVRMVLIEFLSLLQMVLESCALLS